MATAPDRVFDGFTDLSTGMDGGKSPSLILSSSVSAASNVSFRGSYVHTRGGWDNIPLTVPTSLTSRWTGKWQGERFYDGSTGNGASGWIVQRGGLVFFIDAASFTLKEITVNAPVTVTKQFTVPAQNASVTINVTSESVFTIGQNITISSGQYLVQNRATNQILIEYLGGSSIPPGSMVIVGTKISDTNSAQQLIFYDSNQSNGDFAYLFQAEFYMVILSGQESPLIWDGSRLRRATKNEIPAGFIGAYADGRIWIAQNNRTKFVAGNLVGDQSGGGTAQLAWVDSILKFTENTFLNGGGAFSIPSGGGLITSMTLLATQDVSLGTGTLLVGTTTMVFSVNAPADRTTWQALTYPIVSVGLVSYGPEGPNSTLSINGDMWFRSIDGIRSFLVVRRYFGDPGNVPSSREMSEILEADTQNLLFYGSAIYFKNRLLQTLSPQRVGNGVQHRGMAVLNFDLLSDLRQKLPPAWDGVWSGINILQLDKARINNTERGFAFALNPDGVTVELWEMSTGLIPDVVQGKRSDIACFIETKSFSFESPFQLDKLYMGELYLDDIADNVTFVVKFRPDQYPTWVTWTTIKFCSTNSQCTAQMSGGTCRTFVNNARSYAARATIPQPDDAACNLVDQGDGLTPLNFGKEFQFRFEWTGHCEIRLFRAHCKIVPDTSEGQCPPVTAICVSFPGCDTNWFGYSSYAGTAVNLIPLGSMYNAQSQFAINLTPNQTYHFTLGANDSILSQGLQQWAAPQMNTPFTAQLFLGICSAVFTGRAPNTPVTAFLSVP